MADRDAEITIGNGDTGFPCTTRMETWSRARIVTGLTIEPKGIPLEMHRWSVYLGEERLVCSSVDAAGNGRFCDTSGRLVVKVPKGLVASGSTKVEVSLETIGRGVSDGHLKTDVKYALRLTRPL